MRKSMVNGFAGEGGREIGLLTRLRKLPFLLLSVQRNPPVTRSCSVTLSVNWPYSA